jgi:SAM-dependent methyltransferase
MSGSEKSSGAELMILYGEAYANEYDQLYSDKNYQAECDLIENAFRQFGTGEVRSVVDFGCGTGNHSIPLARRGYNVTGVDLSAEMLRVARQKSVAAGVTINWAEGDIRTVQAGGPFDAGLFMFAVLGYLLPNEDVMAALINARRQIRTGGLLAFDVWYGPAVLNIRPSDRAKVVPDASGKVIRIVTPRLDVRHHTCEVHYHLWRLIGDHVAAESEELHPVRYFFPMELELMFSQSGFALTLLTAFPTLDIPANETTWNVFGVAHAV